jgi:hypothetical protein
MCECMQISRSTWQCPFDAGLAGSGGPPQIPATQEDDAFADDGTDPKTQQEDNPADSHHWEYVREVSSAEFSRSLDRCA